MASHSKSVLAAWLFAALVCASPAFGAVIQTLGDGTAVFTVEASAEFEDPAAVTAVTYMEDTLEFTRVGLSQNGCPNNGCPGHPGFVGFSGEFMYGIGNGYFSIETTGGQFFTGLEFRAGTGYATELMSWEAYRLGTLVGSGTLLAPSVVNVGFSDSLGFDELRYIGTAPAFDSVLAQFDGIQAVPDAASSLFLMGVALLGLNEIRRRSPSDRSH